REILERVLLTRYAVSGSANSAPDSATLLQWLPVRGRIRRQPRAWQEEAQKALIRLSAWRTVALGATETSGGAAEPFFAASSCATATRSVSRIWFSRSHSSLYTLER